MDDPHGHGSEEEAERVTSPMQEFASDDVGVGLAVLVLGVLVTFGVPLVLV
jgi:hypothetical protein